MNIPKEYVIQRYCPGPGQEVVIFEAPPGMDVRPAEPAGPTAAPPAPEPLLPPLRTRIRNLARTAADVVIRAVETGELAAPQAVQAARLAVCERGEGLQADQTRDGSCDRWRPSDRTCSACGCHMRAKASLAASSCPLGRWKE